MGRDGTPAAVYIGGVTPGVYICRVYRDRPREFRWILRPKLVDQCTTTLDLDDPASLDAALVSAARRDRGDEADMDLYCLEVITPGGQALTDWRYNGWLDGAPGEYGAYGYGR